MKENLMKLISNLSFIIKVESRVYLAQFPFGKLQPDPLKEIYFNQTPPEPPQNIARYRLLIAQNNREFPIPYVAKKWPTENLFP